MLFLFANKKKRSNGGNTNEVLEVLLGNKEVLGATRMKCWFFESEIKGLHS